MVKKVKMEDFDRWRAHFCCLRTRKTKNTPTALKNAHRILENTISLFR